MRAVLLPLLLCLGSMAQADPAGWEAERLACIAGMQSEEDLAACRKVLFFACAAEHAEDPTDPCMAAEAAAWDADLALFWPQMQAQQEGEALAALNAAQAAWLAWREAECGFQVSAAGQGADLDWLALQCRAELTATRSFGMRVALNVGLAPLD